MFMVLFASTTFAVDWVNIKGDSVEHKVKWTKSLSSLSGEPICIEFQLKNAQLFGFYLY